MLGNDVVCTRDGDLVTIVINDKQASALGAMIGLAMLKIDDVKCDLSLEFLIESYMLYEFLEPKLKDVLGIKD